jgi:phage shock protein A
MGILDRTSTILGSNVEAMLEQADDPEAAIDRLLRDMADAIAQARDQVAGMIVQEESLRTDRDLNLGLAKAWGDTAAVAVGGGADDLARESLRLKLDYEHNAQAYAHLLRSQSEVAGKLGADAARLEAKYESTARNRVALVARHRGAPLANVARTAVPAAATDSASDLARMDERIRLGEPRPVDPRDATAGPALEHEHGDAADDDGVDRALAALRARIGARSPDA